MLHTVIYCVYGFVLHWFFTVTGSLLNFWCLGFIFVRLLIKSRKQLMLVSTDSVLIERNHMAKKNVSAAVLSTCNLFYVLILWSHTSMRELKITNLLRYGIWPLDLPSFSFIFIITFAISDTSLSTFLSGFICSIIDIKNTRMCVCLYVCVRACVSLMTW